MRDGWSDREEMRKCAKNVVARFIGKDGSMGFRNGEKYKLWFFQIGKYYYISRRSMKATAIPYGSITAVEKNWEFLDETTSLLEEKDKTIAYLQLALDKANEKLAYTCGDTKPIYDEDAGRRQLNAERDAIKWSTLQEALKEIEKYAFNRFHVPLYASMSGGEKESYGLGVKYACDAIKGMINKLVEESKGE